MEHDLKTMLAADGLKLETSKTKVMKLYNKRERPDTAKVYKSVEQLSILGMIFAKRIKWTNHVSNMVTRLSDKLNKTMQMRKTTEFPTPV